MGMGLGLNLIFGVVAYIYGERYIVFGHFLRENAPPSWAHWMHDDHGSSVYGKIHMRTTNMQNLQSIGSS